MPSLARIPAYEYPRFGNASSRIASLLVILLMYSPQVRAAEESGTEADTKITDIKKLPRSVLEREIARNEKERDEIIQDLKPLRERQKSIVNQKNILKASTENFEVDIVSSTIDTAKNSFSRVLTALQAGKSPAQKDVEELQTNVGKILSESRRLLKNANEALVVASDSDDQAEMIYRLSRTSNPDLSRELYLLSQVHDGFEEPVDRPEILLKKMLGASSVINSLSVDWFRETVKKALDEATEKLENAGKELDSEISELEKRIKSLDRGINDKLVEIESRDTKKNEIDSLLIWAIVGMVAVLYLLYLTTRVFHNEVQKIIFQQRTLVEIVGMAFLLLTIIILGTGEKMDRSVLGALLGTIAGYIFGSQLRARAVQEQDQFKPNISPLEGLRAAASGPLEKEAIAPLPKVGQEPNRPADLGGPKP